MTKRKRAMTLLLSLVMLLSLLSAGASAADLPFTDVSPDAWYYPGISFAYNAKLMNGTGETTFAPEESTTRGMFVTMLYRMAGTPSVDRTGTAGDITDIQTSDYYYDPVLWALSNSIVSGYGDGTFRPGSTVTREEMAVFFCRYAKLENQDMTARADLSKFSDAGSVSSWAKEEMSWAVASGLITGLSETLLGPGGSASRAQVATIFMRLDSLINDTPITPPRPPVDKVVKVEFKKLSGISATVTGYDKDGGTVWTYKTPPMEDLMLDRVDDIGQKGSAYYFVEDGSVVALDVQTGNVLWRNGDFKGYGSASAMGDAIYLCGFFGPDFYAISYDGKTLARIEQFHNDYMWAYKIDISGSYAIVHMSGGPNGDGIDQPFHVDLTNYTVKLG